MADFACRVVRISAPVMSHPDADRLSLVKIGGYTAIAGKLSAAEANSWLFLGDRKYAEGDHRYAEGDHVVYIPEGAVLPEPLLREMGFWLNDRGTLAGKEGNRVKALRLRGILSQGVLYPVHRMSDDDLTLRVPIWINGEDVGSNKYSVQEGQDVSGMLGVTKYVPVVPTEMQGDAIPLYGGPMHFDFESIQSIPDLFEPGERVHVTEKLHGTMVQIGYVPGLNNRQCFFDGNVYVTQKGIGNSGLALMDRSFAPPPALSWPRNWIQAIGERLGFVGPRPDVPSIANERTIYVKVLRELLADGFGERLRAESQRHNAPVRVFGEIFGKGVQDLHYGQKTFIFRVFDVTVGNTFQPPNHVAEIAKRLKLGTVPALHVGPYDLAELENYRDGRDAISGTHIREGIVIRSMTEQPHIYHGRKIAKWVSPAYLLRKGAGEEGQ